MDDPLAECSKTPAVCLNGVSFWYGDRLILDDVNLDIERGDFVCVVGPNGGGKTTLLRLILGLEKPGKGRLRLFGEKPDAARGRIGYVPQNPTQDLRFPIAVLEVVMMGCLGGRFLGWHTGGDRRAARVALERVGLADLERRPFQALSGGQRQRVYLARALVGEPEILLLDEPMANVDPAREREFEEMLKSLDHGMTVVLVSHDLRFVTDIAETVVCVNRHVAVHPTAEVSAESIGEIYGQPVRVVQHARHLASHEHDHG